MHRRHSFEAGDPEWDPLEAQWLRELRAGGPGARAAWSSLYEVFGDLFEKRLRLYGVDPGEVEDVAQDVWMEIRRAAGNWREEKPARIFLLGFLKNVRMRYREVRRGQSRFDSLDDEAILAVVESTLDLRAAPSPLAAEWIDFARCVRRAWSELEQASERLAQMLLLHHVEQLSLEEVAQELGGDAKLAKGQVFSARRKLEPELLPCLQMWPNRQRGRT